MSGDRRKRGDAIVTKGAVPGLLAIAVLAGLTIMLGVSPRADAMPLGPKALYSAQCASCHGEAMEGGQFGPSLKNGDFANRWRGKQAELLKYIRENMPPASSGQVSDAEYVVLTDIIAQANALDEPTDPSAPRRRQQERVGYLGPRAAPELFRDPTYERAARGPR